MQLLHSQVIGEGKPLFILHGFLGMADNWRTMGLKFAAEGFQVHLIDQRNHGHSFHSQEFTYELMVQDLLAYAQAKNVEKPIILGHSMGGKTAMLYAVLHPNLLEKLIVVDIAPKFYPVHHQMIIDGLSSIDFEKIQTRKQADEQLSKYVLDAPTRQFLLKNLYWKTKEKLDFRFNLIALRQNLEEIGKGLPQETIFKGATLFLAGAKSNYIKENDRDLIYSHFPNAQIETVSRAGHWLHAENPEEFFTKVLQFLQK